MRIKGHALSMEWSGEYGAESSSTGTCACGSWEESASSQKEVRFEYREHLKSVARSAQPQTPEVPCCQHCVDTVAYEETGVCQEAPHTEPCRNCHQEGP